MKYIFLILIFDLSLPVIGFSQSDFDYTLINKVIRYEEEVYGRDSVSFLNYFNYKSETFNTKKRKPKEKIARYALAVQGLFKDTLQAYQKYATARKVKKTFVKWDKDKIDFPDIVEKENANFFYHTQPIVLSETLFVTLSLMDCKGGGVSACLWEFDKSKGTVIPIKYKTIMRYGLKFR